MKITNLRGDKTIDLSLTSTIIFSTFIMLFCILGVGYWSATAQLSSASIAIGKLVTEKENQKIQHEEGGVVEAIHVQEGDFVSAGQLLVTLSDPVLAGDIEKTKQSLFIVEARLRRVNSLLNETQIEWSGMSSDANDVQRLIFADQEALLNQTKLIHAERMFSLQEKLVQAKQETARHNGWLSSDVKSLKLLNEELDANAKLLDKGYVSKIAYLELKRERESLSARIGEHRSNIAASISRSKELSKQLDSLPVEFRKTAQEEKQQLTMERETLEDQLQALIVLGERVKLKSPVDGLVMSLESHTQGGVVTPGQVILEVVPDSSRLLASVKVAPQDIESVYKGLNASVRLSSFSFRSTPPVIGHLLHISADSIVDERTGSMYYEGKIALSEDQVADLGLELKPGMPVEAQIVLDDRTLLDYLISPLAQSVERGLKEI
ncbi:HlyD family type I secretion periplasmic adaptor subunit [Vibrio barjaei]|uniref:HlyD family type I secretion periplasmic adaptor subunit n=1 Tax=Vibrio barjaei TaxID=1676683 RepID=UPI00228330F5|nr:HlyD family type I secretion periplasmic adaptor subunit [Vibrio barjaei]MCY9870395.1 HlyD family type I secretion periplasmic adaptor subunit [Vibrio barjaei]